MREGFFGGTFLSFGRSFAFLGFLVDFSSKGLSMDILEGLSVEMLVCLGGVEGFSSLPKCSLKNKQSFALFQIHLVKRWTYT